MSKGLGRKKDSWQVPRRSRRRCEISFLFRDGLSIKFICGVPEPILENLRKRRDELCKANRDQWFPLKSSWNEEAGTYLPVLDPKTGQQTRESFLVAVTAKILGADL